MLTNKICKDCKIDKDVNEFRQVANSGVYLQKPHLIRPYRHVCKKCETIRCYKRYLLNRTETNRKNVLKKYNFIEEDYRNMLIEQNNKCKICGIDNDEYGKNFHIDHCHKTKKVRGLLCSKCNHGLGLFNDDKSILISAFKYLLESQFPM